MLQIREHDFIHKSHLQVSTDLSEIHQVLEWFEQFQLQYLSKNKSTQVLLFRARIALAEGFTNAVRHAHQDVPQETPIDLEVLLFPDRLDLHIWDQGSAFNLTALLDTVEQQYPNPEEHDAHWGGTIFRRLSVDYGWNIQYCCPGSLDSDRNCLQIQMPL
jgi:serine/threonine-protein kinase RsbW